MSIVTVQMYRVVCDEAGCDASPQDRSEHYAWLERDGALDELFYVAWQSTDDGQHYCPDHTRSTEDGALT